MSSTLNVFDTFLITSSPSDAVLLRSGDAALNRILDTKAPIKTPERQYIRRLTKTTERFLTTHSIIRCKNKESKDVVRVKESVRKIDNLFLGIN